MLLANSIQVYLKTTETCNLNCRHCFTNGKTGSKIFFDPVKTSRFLTEITKKNHVTSTRILYHGGEPMLAPLKDLYKFYELTVNSIPGISYGIQTNLVYTLTSEKINFFETVLAKTGLGTSWDPDIRFGSNHAGARESQLKLWESNVQALTKMGFECTLMVSLSKSVVCHFKPIEIINYAISVGFKYILFERLTDDGNAHLNTDIFPGNAELDQWILQMYQETMDNQLYKKIGNMFLEELAQSTLFRIHSANRCRGCEQKLITINANGTVSGCPNSATQVTWGHINEDTDKFLQSPQRIGAICKEKIRNVSCMTCEVSDLCNGDCYKLKWEGNICAAPKSLLKQLKETKQRDNLRNLIL